MRAIITKNHAAAVRLEEELLEEGQWRGGHEAGESDN